MPKIVDHDQEKKRIAEEAIGIFRRRGYSSLSFREIARELGMSKSGLYHYFSGKEELFSFCGTIFLNQLTPDLSPGPEAVNSDESPAAMLIELARALSPEYLAELRLIIDYADCFSDKSELKQFLESLEQQMVPVTGEKNFPAALRLILGDLLVKALTDENDDWSVLRDSLGRLYRDN